MAAAQLGPVILAGLLGGVLATGCASQPGPRDSAGTVTAAATTDAYGLLVGDCTGQIPTGEADEFTLVPCGQAHHWEVFAALELTGTEYPGSDQVQDEAEAFCNDEFERFIGVSVSKSDYNLVVLQPTQQTWESAADRAVTCLAGARGGGIEGTLAGVGG